MSLRYSKKLYKPNSIITIIKTEEIDIFTLDLSRAQAVFINYGIL